MHLGVEETSLHICRSSLFGAGAAGVVLAVSALLLGTAAPAAAASFPVQPNIASATLAAAANPEQSPPGTNNFNCKPTAAHPFPVVLIPGTFSVMEDDFGALAPILANNGYCVFSLNYGGTKGALVQAIGPAATSVQQVAALVTKVKQATGVSRVDLVGHSQGGMLGEYYLKVAGGAPNVHAYVGLSPTTHGTTLDGLTNLATFFPGANEFVGALCQACVDQEAGSAFLAPLDAGPIAQAGVHYTVIETLNETVVTPVGSSFIRESGVTNQFVQGQCVNDTVDHADLPYDQVTIRDVLNALDPAHAVAPNCLTAFPFPA
ncbi:MAG TPA: alpha/beta fold hydrolase [Pseudonocardiaceae bacterium]|nr:alpha/beta fold hydrolase [Pseudonocardiaceae bacterium]